MNTKLSLLKRLTATAVLSTAIAGVLIAVQEVPEWQVRRANVRPETTPPAEVASLQNEMRKTFVQVVGGIFVSLALYLTYRRTKVTEQGHITDRYTKAIEQLGATKLVGELTEKNLEVRLGAIYALERIALDSPRDHWTIMEVLTTYIRENAPIPATKPSADATDEAIRKGPPSEIRTILTVLGRRRRDGRRERKEQRLDLRRCDLRGASFSHAHFERADLSGCSAEGADFNFAHFEYADFSQAQLTKSGFNQAFLQNADFRLANADEAEFKEAHMEKAKLAKVSANKAHFSSAHLSGADFAHSQLENADFSQIDGRNAFFTSAHLKGSVFENSKVQFAIFKGADLEKSNFFAAAATSTDFRETSLREANLNAAHLENADFNKATLVKASLIETHLTRALFWEASLIEANFREARLQEASFWGANVERANFMKADVKGRDTIGEDEKAADFSNVIGLTGEQIRKADGWKEPRYDVAFARALGLFANRAANPKADTNQAIQSKQPDEKVES